MKKLKTLVFGAGFVGRVHIEAIRRLGNVELCGIGIGPDDDAKKLGAELNVDRVSADYRELLKDREVDAVHICTPNASHFPIAKAALEAGKHVLCEKPLATSATEARELVELAQMTGLRNCTFHNLRFYPMIQQARRICESGELGEILIVQGTYSQDWLLSETDWNWRLSATEGGRSRCLADIGSHWCETRKKPKHAVDTFSGKPLKPEDYDDVSIDTEDYAAVMFRMGDRTRGCFTVSQVSAGRKNSYRFEIVGTKAGVPWDGEKQDELWIGHRSSPNQLLLKDPSLLKPEARSYADLPGGHSEGYDDTFKQVFRRFYRSIENPDVKTDYPQFADGLRQLNILDAEFASNESQGWVSVR